LCLKKLIIDLIDKFWKNFKVLILLLKTNSPPSWFFVRTLKLFVVRYQQILPSSFTGSR